MVLKVNDKGPLFVLPDQNDTMISLKDFLGKWVVLYFYPKDNTPGCTIEAVDFSARKKDFGQRNAVILGVSPDSMKSHCSFQEKQNLTITLLSDEKKEVLEKYGVWGKKKFMGKEYMGVLRTTYLIDPQGKIRSIWKDVNVKGHVEEVLAFLSDL